MLIIYLSSVFTLLGNIHVESGYVISPPTSHFNTVFISDVSVENNKHWCPTIQLSNPNCFLIRYKHNMLREGKGITIRFKDTYTSLREEYISLFEVRKDVYKFCLGPKHKIKEAIIGMIKHFIKYAPLNDSYVTTLINGAEDKFFKQILKQMIEIVEKSKLKQTEKTAEKLYKYILEKYKKYINEGLILKISKEQLTLDLEIYEKIKNLVSYINLFVDPFGVKITQMPSEIDFGYIKRCLVIKMRNYYTRIIANIIEETNTYVNFCQKDNIICINYFELMKYDEVTLFFVGMDMNERITLINQHKNMSFEIK